MSVFYMKGVFQKTSNWHIWAVVIRTSDVRNEKTTPTMAQLVQYAMCPTPTTYNPYKLF